MSRTPGKRIVMTSWGSYGDLFPYIGLAKGLTARGFEPVLATLPYYRDIVEGEGIEFHPVRPDVDPEDRALVRRIMDPVRGSEVIIRELMLPSLRDSYDDLAEATRGADLLVTHPITFAGPVLAAERSLPWVSTILAPLSFFSAYDIPVFPPMPRAVHIGRLGPWAGRLMVGLARAATRKWSHPVYELRRSLGLPAGGDPLFEGQFSPALTLALFSRVLATPQPDWPPNVMVAGFVSYAGHRPMPDGLAEYLDDGPAPIVFTLGTSAVGAAGRFYHESAEAARRLGVRAVLLVGTDPANRPSGGLPPGVVAVEYAPHAALFPRAAVVVHQGGIGTTGQALRAGRPALVVPYAHDQPDNAWRVTRLGVARTLYPTRYSASRVAAELAALLGDTAYARRAREVAEVVQSEDGMGAACDAIEQVLRGGRPAAR